MGSVVPFPLTPAERAYWSLLYRAAIRRGDIDEGELATLRLRLGLPVVAASAAALPDSGLPEIDPEEAA